MTANFTSTDRESWPDQTLLCSAAQHDLNALRELHRRYAPLLYAVAHREGPPDFETRVQHIWDYILRHAHCAARSSLEVRVWMVAMAQRAPTGGRP